MSYKITVDLGSENYANTQLAVDPSALGAEFLGWEFFSDFGRRQDQVNFTHIRWPGGIPVEEGINVDGSSDGSREVVFDLKFDNLVEWDRKKLDPITGEPLLREGIKEIMSYAIENGMSFALVTPTKRYIEAELREPGSGVALARADMRIFAERLVAGEFGPVPAEFTVEIGSEYYNFEFWKEYFGQPGVNVARTIGDVFAALSDELNQIVDDAALNTTGVEVNIAVQMGRNGSREDDPSLGFDDDGVIVGGWGEYGDNLDFIEAFKAIGALDAVDSLIWHRYVPNFWGIERGIWEPVRGHTVSSVKAMWEEAVGKELGLVVGHLSPTAQGQNDLEFNAPGLTNILQLTTGMLASGMDTGSIFGLGFDTDGSLGFRGYVFLGGQLYGMMVESLPGMYVHDGYQNNTSPIDVVWDNGRVVSQTYAINDSVNKYVFENEDQVVIFLVAKDFQAESLDYEILLDETFEYSEITRLWDTGKEYKHPQTGQVIGRVGEISRSNDVRIEEANGSSTISVTFNYDYEVIRLVLDREVIDTFEGTDGNDFFRINHSADVIQFAGQGRDTVQTEVDFDLRDHSNGNDIEYLWMTGSEDLRGTGNGLDNTITGNSGNNTINGAWGDDTLSGDDGDDRLYGSNGKDYLFGGRGDDTLSGGNGGDALFGGDRDDLLFGEGGDDTLDGGLGIDTLIGGSGKDVFMIDATWADLIKDFEPGEDKLDLSIWGAKYEDLRFSYSVNSDLFIIYDSEGRSLFLEGFGVKDKSILNRLENFIFADDEMVILTNKDDVEYSGAGNDTIYGKNGDDALFGESGNDKLSGGNGADTLDGGDNFDVADYSDATSKVRIDLVDLSKNKGEAQGDIYSSIESFEGSGYGDSFLGDKTQNWFFGMGSDDELRGRAGRDRLFAGTGDDMLNGGKGRDRLEGDDGDDWLVGMGGKDNLRGGKGDDTLNGGVGDDRIIGGSGRDYIIGGVGNDVMSGSTGSDSFIFKEGHGNDVIEDFDVTKTRERIDFSGIDSINSLEDLFGIDGAARQIGENTLIRTGEDSSVLLKYTLIENFDDTDFIF